MEQQSISVLKDDTGDRKARLLGIPQEHDIIIAISDTARFLHGALERYQQGVVQVNMSKMPAKEAYEVLSRLWSDTCLHHTNLGVMLEKYAPLNDAIEKQLEAEEKALAEAEKSAAADAAKRAELEAQAKQRAVENPPAPNDIDQRFRNFMGEKPADPSDEDKK